MFGDDGGFEPGEDEALRGLTTPENDERSQCLTK